MPPKRFRPEFNVNAELLAWVLECEAEAARRGRGQGRPPEEEDEGEEAGTITAGGDAQ